MAAHYDSAVLPTRPRRPRDRLFAQPALARGDGRYARLQRTLGHVQGLIMDN